MPVVVGLTGAIATGKSSASRVFRSKGVPVIDADEVARKVVEKGSLGLLLIRASFGTEVLRADGTLDREAMGRVIFSDPSKRKRLNMCTHPLIILDMARQLVIQLLVKFEPVVVLDTPLLFETKVLLSVCTVTVVVACSEENQLARLRARNQLSQEDAEKRIRSQMPLADKRARASVVIENDDSLEELERRVANALSGLRPARGAETAFRALAVGTYAAGAAWLLRTLVRTFFGSLKAPR